MRMNYKDYTDQMACDDPSRIASKGNFVYICSPFRGDIRVNVMRARRYCRFAVSKGRIPIAPHLYFPQFVSDTTERETAFGMNFELMKLCSEVWVFGVERSEGMTRELAHADALGKTILYFTTSCEEVSYTKIMGRDGR